MNRFLFRRVESEVRRGVGAACRRAAGAASPIASGGGVLSLLVAALLSACADEGGLDGSLVVRLGRAWGAPPAGRSLLVFVGDGSRLVKSPDANGDVVFEDDSLSGAVDVTFVDIATEGVSERVAVLTLAGVDRAEISPGSLVAPPVAEAPPAVVYRTFAGRVSGGTPGNQVFVVPAGVRADGMAMAAASGDYALQAQVAPGHPLTLAALDRSLSGAFARMGIRAVDVPAEERVNGVDIELTHAFEHLVSVGVQFPGVLAAEPTVQFELLLGERVLATFGGTGTATHWSLPRPDGELSALVRKVEARAQSARGDGVPDWLRATRLVAPDADGCQVMLPPISPLPAAPALGSSRSAPKLARSDLRFEWSAPPDATHVELLLTTSDFGAFTWRIIAAGAGKLPRLELPAGRSALTPFASGLWKLEYTAVFDAEMPWAKLQQGLPAPRAARDEARSGFEGYFRLE